MTKPETAKERSFSPGPYVAAGYVTIFLAFGVFGTWAATAPLASGVVASGIVSVEGNRKTIQHLEGGIVSEILAEEGDVVDVGDVLVKLDTTSAQGNYSLWSTRLLYLQATAARLIAESTGSDTIEFPEEVRDNGNPDAKTAMTLQRGLFEDRLKTRDGKISILKARVSQLTEATKGIEHQLAAIDKQIESMESELERLNEGLKKGVVSVNQHSQTTRSYLEFQSRRGELDSDLAQVRANIDEAELQIVQTGQEFVERAVSEHKDVRDQISEASERTRVAKDVLTRTSVRAPVRGMVQNIRIHTANGVIKPADPILDIVPLDDDLVVHARIRPIDIDSVDPKADVEVRFSAFSSKSTPAIFGRVSVLGKDVIEPGGQQEPFYLAVVTVDDKAVPMDLRGRIVAGMPVEVIISTGERTFAQYLIKPLVDSFHRGMKEE